jgi:hypothetical protein
VGHLDPEPDLLVGRADELEEGAVPVADRGDLQERLLGLELDRHEGHDEAHDLVDRVHPVDRRRELLAAVEPAAELVDRRPRLREGGGLLLVGEVVHVGDGDAGGREPAVLAGDLDRGHARPGLGGDQVAVAGGLDAHDAQERARGVEPVGREVRRGRAVLHGEAERRDRAGALHRVEQPLAGGPVDLELRAAPGVDDDVVERYDGFSLRFFV